MRKVYEGTVVEIRKEDGGQALIAEVQDNPEAEKGIFIRVQSWDEDLAHEEWNKLGFKEGKKVKFVITVEDDKKV